jgi:hypothetical protein
MAAKVHAAKFDFDGPASPYGTVDGTDKSGLTSGLEQVKRSANTSDALPRQPPPVQAPCPATPPTWAASGGGGLKDYY